MEYNILFNAKMPLYVFHWDTDGIASAALLKIILNNNPKLYTPRIGLYTLKFINKVLCKNVDSIYIIDLGVSNDEIYNFGLKCGLNPVVIDHHYREYDNRINIINLSNKELYPSTTLLISDVFKIKYNILTILGIVGDYGNKIYRSKYLELVEDISKKYNLNVEDLINLTSLIDSNYISLDRSGVIRAVDILIRYFNDPHKLLKYDPWLNKCKKIMEEVDKILKYKPINIGKDIYLLEFNSKFFITSVIGRELAHRYRGSYVVVGRPKLYNRYSQIYVRISDGNKRDLFKNIIKKLINMGFNAGGKDDVFGVILPSRFYKKILTLIIQFLKSGE